MDPNSAYAAYSTEQCAGWPGWLVARTGTVLRRLADRGRDDDVAVHGAVRDLAGLPEVTGVRLVDAAIAGRTGPGQVIVPAGPGRVLALTGPAADRPEIVQAVGLVARAIEGRLAGRDEERAGDAVRHAIDRADLRETQDLLRFESVRLRTLIDSIPLAILVVDEQLRIDEVNTAALGMMRVSEDADSVLGARLTKLAEGVHPQAREIVQIAIDFAQRSIGGRKPVRREEIRLPDGTMVEASYQPVDLDGRVRGHLLMGQDVTGRVAAQAALEEHNRELNELRVLKNEFLATVSHELRTPLTAASSLLEALAENTSDGTAQGTQRAEIVRALRRNTGRLTVIVEYLLMLARLESNRVALRARPVDTCALVAERIATVRAGGRSGVTLIESLGEGPEHAVVGDPDWLLHMVHYVIAGAVASSAPGAELTVHSEVRDERWTLSVHGAGLRLRDSGQVHSAIVPSGTDADEVRIGASLGLFLAQAIAHRHGGRVVIEPGRHGSRITASVSASGPV